MNTRGAEYNNRSIILASKSEIRKTLLQNAGVKCTVKASLVDEEAVKLAISGEGTDMQPADVAMILAQAKAMNVSQFNPGEMVVGADQILVCEGRRYDKPETLDAAREQLFQLRGKTHTLISAVACAVDGKIIWSHDQSVHLTMRNFSNSFVGSYMAEVGNDILTSVGAYKLEGPGVQLFEKIDGDYFSVLGLPLLQLLAFLREHGHLET